MSNVESEEATMIEAREKKRKSKQQTENDDQSKTHSFPTIRDPEQLKKYGIVKAPISADFDRSKWAAELSQCTPMNLIAEGDDEYVFYRNILEEPGFPFQDILNSAIGDAISKYFTNDVKDIQKDLRLDDAFCIHYNTTQSDTTCGRHMDPSDITVNLCLESEDVVGSEVLFYGSQNLCLVDNGANEEKKDGEENEQKVDDATSDFQFLVEQEAGFATIHFGGHAHETMPLKSGNRTNIVFTYCYTDESKSEATRICFF